MALSLSEPLQGWVLKPTGFSEKQHDHAEVADAGCDDEDVEDFMVGKDAWLGVGPVNGKASGPHAVQQASDD